MKGKPAGKRTLFHIHYIYCIIRHDDKYMEMSLVASWPAVFDVPGLCRLTRLLLQPWLRWG